MDKKPCPICTRLNDPQDTHCWFCHAELLSSKEEPAQNGDWLSGLRQDGDAPAEPGGADSAGIDANSGNEQEEFVPDWLARIRDREAVEKAEKKAQEERYWAEKKSRDGLPDWLRSLNEDTTDDSGNDAPRAAVTPDKSDSAVGLPAAETAGASAPVNGDWLESLKTWQAAETNTAEAPVAGEVPHSDGDQNESSILPETPVWQDAQEPPESDIDLEKIFSPAEPLAEPEADAPGGSTETLLPEGFSPLESELKLPAEAVTPAPEDAPAPIEAADASEAPFIPDFLMPETSADQESTASPEPAEEPETSANTPFFANGQDVEANDDAGIRDDLQPIVYSEKLAHAPESDTAFVPEKFDPGDLPEWLADIKPAEPLPAKSAAPRKTLPVVDDGSPEPEKANLPAWLQSRRPVEAVGSLSVTGEGDGVAQDPDVQDAVAQEITGVSAFVGAGKPSDLGSGLNVSNRQKTNATLLSALLTNSESLEEPAAAVGNSRRSTLFRTLLAIVFIVLAILGGTLFKSYSVVPALYPEEVVRTFDLVNSIPLDKPVLVAGDYEAAFSGELRLASQSLLEHLMRRGLRMALLSLNPVDSTLLPNQVARAATAVPAYQTSASVIDLGYLPGGGIAIQGLGNSFVNTVPLTADLQPLSDVALLRGVSSLSDFGAVVVITDRSENARIWIEQIQPLLGSTPLLLVSSAQASPLIQPYYQSGQVAGLVSGMFGGMIYERILGVSGSAGGNFISLQLILALMASLALLGGFVSLVRPADHGRKPR
jgi:hypothetical protein